MTTPPDPRGSSYGNGAPEPGAAPDPVSAASWGQPHSGPGPAQRPAQRAAIEDTAPRSADSPAPVPGHRSRPPSPQAGPPPPRTGRRRRLAISLVAAVVGLLGGTVAVLLWRAAPEPGPAPTPRLAPAPLREAGLPPVPMYPRGDATLSNPTIATAKTPHRVSAQWCELLTAADVQAVTGFAQRGAPDDSFLCTHYLVDNAGYLFVSDIPASVGAPYTVRGNTAIIYQNDPAACEVSVALNRDGGVLDIDLRGVISPRVPLCEAAVALAGRALDKLPAARPR